MKVNDGGETARALFNRAAGKFQSDSSVTAAVCTHCISFVALSITLVSLWVSAGTEVWLR